MLLLGFIFLLAEGDVLVCENLGVLDLLVKLLEGVYLFVGGEAVDEITLAQVVVIDLGVLRRQNRLRTLEVLRSSLRTHHSQLQIQLIHLQSFKMLRKGLSRL